MDALDILTALSVAVLSSFTHCVAMCGGLNLAFLALNRPQKDENSQKNSRILQDKDKKSTENSRIFQNKNEQNAKNPSQNRPQNLQNQAFSQTHQKPFFALILLYHFARICVYMALGAVFYCIGQAALMLNQALFFFVLGCFMVLLGTALLCRGSLLKFFENPYFFNKILAYFGKKFTLKGVKSALILGALNGIVPCGLVYFFIILAMKQESLANALFIMLCFGLATSPALLIFAKITQIFSEKFTKLWTKISYFIIIFYGIYLAYLGFSAFK